MVTKNKKAPLGVPETIKLVDNWILLFVGRARRMTQYTHHKGAYANHFRARTGCEQSAFAKPNANKTDSARWSSKASPNKKGHFTGVLFYLVETSGLEPLTPCMSSKYSNQLSYASKAHLLYTFLHFLSRPLIDLF